MSRDPIARLTPLGLVLLALLDEGDMHPYEMIRLMRQRHDDRLVATTNGTVYYTVARLEGCGLLAEVGVDREGNRPERTTYTLTAAGRDAIAEWVRRELARIDRPVEFRVALAEAHNLSRAEVVELLGIRRTALAASHERERAAHREALARGVPEQFLVEVERAHVLLDAELGWLDGLVARLAAGGFAWGPTAYASSDRYLAQREAARR